MRGGCNSLFDSMYSGKEDSAYVGATTWRSHGLNTRLVEAFTKRHNTTLHVLWNITIVHRFVPVYGRNHRQVLAMAVSGDHGWFYSSPEAKRAIAQMELKGVAPRANSKLLVEEPEDPDKDIGSYDDCAYISSEAHLSEQHSHYRVCPEQVDAVRAELIGQGVAVKVHMRSVKDIRALSFQRGKGRTMIHVEPDHADLLSTWCYVLEQAGLHVPYKGQPHSSYGFRVLRAAVARQLKFARELPSREVRQEILEAQAHTCRKCGEAGPLEIDHITPLSAGGSNDRSNLWGICSACHAQKT